MTRRLASLLSLAPLLACALLLTRPVHAQSAWTLPEGESFLQATVTRIGPYDELFTERGPSFRTGREITETSVELYGELGLAGGWTLVGNVPLRSVESGSLVGDATIQPVTIDAETLTGLGNVLLGVRRQFLGGPTALAAQLDVELPTGTEDSSSGLATGLDTTTVRPWLSVGRGWGRTYAQAHAGYSLRTNDYSDDWRLGVEVGCQATEDFLCAFTLDLVESLENGSPDLDPRRLETGLFVDEQEYLSAGLKGLYRLGDSVGVSAAVRGAFSGDNVPEAPYLGLGLYWRP